MFFRLSFSRRPQICGSLPSIHSRVNRSVQSASLRGAARLCGALVCAGILSTANIALAESPEAVPGEFIIKYKAAANNPSRQARIRATLGVDTKETLPLISAQVVRTSGSSAIDHEYVKNLLASGLVDYVEPNYIYHAQATPNDSMYSQLWGMHNTGQTGGTADIDIDAPEAWSIVTGGTTVVGVVDTGVDYNHPELRDNMWVNPGEIAGNSIDDDNNGYIDDVHGINAITNSGNPFDDNSHGTHCSGTIGGVGNNGAGVVGVNWNTKIMGLKFLDANGSGSTTAAIKTIEYAVMMKQRGTNIRVLSNSWGGGGSSQALQSAIEAANTAGILFVAAAGNDSSDNDSVPSYPANYSVPNVISVAAIDHNGNLASFSNYGRTKVHLAAPGVSIVSTIPGSLFGNYSGTSMATPHVSGVAALVLNAESTLTVAQLKDRLLRTVMPLATLQQVVSSGGMLNAFNALTNAQSPEPPAPDPGVTYTKRSAAYSYDTTLGTRVLNTDDGYNTQTLGFTLPFYGVGCTRIAISANGRLVPLTADQSEPTEQDYSNQNRPGLNVFQDDLFPRANGSDTGGVWFKANGDSATITWVVVPYAFRAGASTDNEIRVQAKLYRSGRIEIHYADTLVGDVNYDYGKSATVGLAPITGATGSALLVSNNTANSAELGNGKSLSFATNARRVRNDFDGDGRSDIVVWRPSNGMFYVRYSAGEFATTGSVQLGLPGDIPRIGDFDGDRKADFAVWRPATGTWYTKTSVSNYAVLSSFQWGLPTDVPIAADVDGDGKTDIGVFRSSSVWGVKSVYLMVKSSGGFNRDAALAGQSTALATVSFDEVHSDPVLADFQGNGSDSPAVVEQLQRFWTIKNSSGQLLSSEPWGYAGDTPHGCHFLGDTKADRVVSRVKANYDVDWYIIGATNTVKVLTFGLFGDVTGCGNDPDGDGDEDLVLYRPHVGIWYFIDRSSSTATQFQWGLPGDIPMM